MDYIVNEWEYIDLTPLGAADSLVFIISSSDSSPMFGINTPGYFCMDNFITSDGVTPVVTLEAEKAFEVYPNPANDFVILKNDATSDAQVRIYDMLGREFHQERLSANIEQINISHLAVGTYQVQIQYDDTVESHLLIKQ